ncbi:MAG TPA: hypothetical protein VFH73_18490 [Polyangia bacterium]|jgi:hypothetical protein|nr:hypothetical protein [Polyangia bacterium]
MKTSNTVTGLFFSALFAMIATSGCGLSIEAEIPEVEVTQKGISFEGVPMAGTLGEVSMTRSFSQQHKALELPAGLDPQVHAIDVTVKATKGIKDFKFLTFLRLAMSDDKNPGKSAELINYQQNPADPASATLTMVSANPVNTLDHWKSDAAIFTMDVAGTLPEVDWSIDITVRFAGSIKYKY